MKNWNGGVEKKKCCYLGFVVFHDFLLNSSSCSCALDVVVVVSVQFHFAGNWLIFNSKLTLLLMATKKVAVFAHQTSLE